MDKILFDKLVSWIEEMKGYAHESLTDTPGKLEGFKCALEYVLKELGQPKYRESCENIKHECVEYSIFIEDKLYKVDCYESKILDSGKIELMDINKNRIGIIPHNSVIIKSNKVKNVINVDRLPFTP